MPDVLWYLQVVGSGLTVALSAGGLLAALYATFRRTPRFVRRLTGVDTLEGKIEDLHSDHLVAQELALQQAEATNELNHTVCELHDIDARDRPPRMNVDAIREELMDRGSNDFTRGD